MALLRYSPRQYVLRAIDTDTTKYAYSYCCPFQSRTNPCFYGTLCIFVHLLLAKFVLKLSYYQIPTNTSFISSFVPILVKYLYTKGWDTMRPKKGAEPVGNVCPLRKKNWGIPFWLSVQFQVGSTFIVLCPFWSACPHYLPHIKPFERVVVFLFL